MSTKHNTSRAAQLGLLPSSTPVFLGGGIPTTTNDDTEKNSKIDTARTAIQELTNPDAYQHNDANLDCLKTKDKTQSKRSGSIHQIAEPVTCKKTNQARHKAQVDAFIDRLTLGRTQPAAVPLAPKTHSITITLPHTTFSALEELAGARQTPTLLRNTMLRLVTETVFQFKIGFKTTIAQARIAFVIARRKARSFGNEGIRFITIHMTTEESLHLIDLSKEFKLAPNQLMEVLAYELVQSSLDSNE